MAGKIIPPQGGSGTAPPHKNRETPEQVRERCARLAEEAIKPAQPGEIATHGWNLACEFLARAFRSGMKPKRE